MSTLPEEAIRAEVATLEQRLRRADHVASDLRAQLHQARERLRTFSHEGVEPVRTQLANLRYNPCVAADGADWVDAIPSLGSLPSKAYQLGTALLATSVVDRARICDLSDAFVDLPESKTSHRLERMECALRRYAWWPAGLGDFDLFKLPRHRGVGLTERTGLDVPDASFLVTYLMLQQEVEFIVVDPTHHSSDCFVRVVNFTHVLRCLQDDDDCRVRVPRQFGPGCAHDAFRCVFHPRILSRDRAHDADEFRARIARALGAEGSSSADLCLQTQPSPACPAPGSSDAAWNREYARACAGVLHQLSGVDAVARHLGKRRCNRLFFVFDQFSATAAYTAVAVLAYGVGPFSSLLSRHRGGFCETPLG